MLRVQRKSVKTTDLPLAKRTLKPCLTHSLILCVGCLQKKEGRKRPCLPLVVRGEGNPWEKSLTRLFTGGRALIYTVALRFVLKVSSLFKPLPCYLVDSALYTRHGRPAGHFWAGWLGSAGLIALICAQNWALTNAAKGGH